MSLKQHFSRFFAASPNRLHFAAHSHHPWPDVSLDAHQQAWLDAAAMADDKWKHVFSEVIPDTQRRVASTLGISDPATVTFGPNTHGFLVRVFSCLEPPVRILSTDAEFHSFQRQSRRWEEAGLAIVDRVPSQPWESFTERFTREARAGVHDLIYLSQVFFDSGWVVRDLDRLVASVPNDRTFVVIDGYHAFMALPVHLGSIQDRVFYLAGGYKYAMAGEGAVFLHAPPGYGPRPVDTGWYAGFGELESGLGEALSYGKDASRFAGATIDPSGVYRLRAVLGWLEEIGFGAGEIHAHAKRLQKRFLDGSPELGELLPPQPLPRGNFLAYRTERAADLYRSLHDRGVITDHRADRIRIGFGIYQEEDDVDRLLHEIAEISRV